VARILVIDDDLFFLRGVREALERDGHDVFTATNGKIGMEIYDSDDFHLVITDILMPEQEGLETIRKLKSLTPALKILAVSGGGSNGLYNFLPVAQKLGADSTLLKPFTWAELLEAVNNLL
jgi:DNA-binding response OmpR family regulator